MMNKFKKGDKIAHPIQGKGKVKDVLSKPWILISSKNNIEWIVHEDNIEILPEDNNVYVVLAYNISASEESRIMGIYNTRDAADTKADRLAKRYEIDSAVLEFKVKGLK